jgi:hypothetical protein
MNGPSWGETAEDGGVTHGWKTFSVKQSEIGRKKASLTRTSSRCLQRTKPPATLYFHLGQAPPLVPLTEIDESLTKVSSDGVASIHAMTVEGESSSIGGGEV